MPVISLGTALFDVFTFIWWPNTCVIHLFYLPYEGTKKKIYEFFCCWRICMWRCLCFLFTTRPHPWHVYFIIKHSFKQNLCLDFFTQWFKNKVEVKCVLECMFNKCVSFFFSSSDCLLLVSIIQTIQLIIYHEKHRHGTKFQF